MGFVKTLLLSAGFSLCLASQAAVVVPVPDGQWQTFDFVPESTSWVDIDGEALQLSITTTQALLFKVVDAGFAGDVFEIRRNGELLGQTSAAAQSYPSSLALDFDAAWLDAAYSKGTFVLLPGTHLITATLKASAFDDMGEPLNATVGAYSLSPVPEAGAWPLALAGLLALGALRRRS